jgi:hypothetical protein
LIFEFLLGISEASPCSVSALQVNMSLPLDALRLLFLVRWAACIEPRQGYVVQTGSGVYPASYPMDNEAISLKIKRPGREADRSPPTSA